MNDKCQELTGSGRGRVQNICGLPIKEEGLCWRHLAGKRRSEKVLKKNREKFYRLGSEPLSVPASAETMTTYTRRDGEPIGDGYGWVTDLEWFEDDDYATELIKETWTKTGSEIIFVNADKIVCTECGANKSQGCDCGAALDGKGGDNGVG